MSRTTRSKKAMPPPEPPLDPRLVALAEQAQRVGWRANWGQPEVGTPWLCLSPPDDSASVCVFSRDGRMSCLASAAVTCVGSPLEALRQAYGALGVALDQAEDAFAQVQEQGEVK